MSVQPVTPGDVARAREAETMGRRAGWNHRMLREDMDRPRDQWCALLREIAVNPWAPGEHPGVVDEVEAARLAKRWAQGFVLGDHEAQGQLRRGNAA